MFDMKVIGIFIVTIVLSNFAFAELFARDLDGNLGNGHEGVYDDVLDITWLADANLAATQYFGVTQYQNSVGAYVWHRAAEWIDAMNVHNNSGWLGINDWRMPNTAPVNGLRFNLSLSYDGSSDHGYQIGSPVNANNSVGQSSGFLGSELSYHYYNNLGGIGTCSEERFDPLIPCIFPDGNWLGNILDPTHQNENISLFENIQPTYWTSEAIDQFAAFFFVMIEGAQNAPIENFGPSFHVWAVTDGDHGSALVPVPATALLFLSAIGGLAFSAGIKY